MSDDRSDEGQTGGPPRTRVVLPVGEVVAQVPEEIAARFPGPVPPLKLHRAWFRTWRGAWELRFHGVALQDEP